MATSLASRPLTARSVVLSVLLGGPREGIAVRDLLALAAELGVAAPTTRVALSRLVAAGELESAGATYRLSEHHLARRRRQEDSLVPPAGEWDGTWAVVVVAGTGRDAADRTALRRELVRRRLGELREGVWTRPDTAGERPHLPAEADPVVLSARPDDPAGLVARLWDLPGWAAEAHSLLDAAAAVDLRERFAVNAAIVRHLQRDPWLPAALLPDGWPAAALRETYEAFRTELASLHPVRREDRP